MGYRTNIAYISKAEYEKIKDMTPEELFNHINAGNGEKFDENDCYISIHEFCKDLHGFGKYTEHKTDGLGPFFTNPKTNQLYHNEDTEFYRVTDKEFLANIISQYQGRIETMFKRFSNPFLGLDNRPGEFLRSAREEFGVGINTVYRFDLSKITPEEETAVYDLIRYARDMVNEWGYKTFDLYKDDEITTSWRYEYAIFELVRIFKSFDWENNIMVYYGG